LIFYSAFITSFHVSSESFASGLGNPSCTTKTLTSSLCVSCRPRLHLPLNISQPLIILIIPVVMLLVPLRDFFLVGRGNVNLVTSRRCWARVVDILRTCRSLSDSGRFTDAWIQSLVLQSDGRTYFDDICGLGLDTERRRPPTLTGNTNFDSPWNYRSSAGLPAGGR
jgi:hypothetical protein